MLNPSFHPLALILFTVLLSVLWPLRVGAEPREPLTHHLSMGGKDIWVLSLGWRDQKADMLLASTPEEKEAVARFYPDGVVRNSQNVLLIRGQGVTALVDTGFARTVPRLYEVLAGAGVRPEDVTHVVITHAHGDHAGGLVSEGKPSFPHARVLLSEAEYAFWMTPGHRAAAPERLKGMFDQLPALLHPYGERVGTFAPGTDLFPSLPGVRAVAAYGHTPGHVGIEVEEGGRVFLFWADLLHAFAMQSDYPEVSATYDYDPRAAAAVRKALLERARREGQLVSGTHVPFVEPRALKQ